MISAIRRVVRQRVLYPIVGRLLDRVLRRCCNQDVWEGIASATAQVLADPSAATIARATVVEVFAKFGPYLSKDSTETLQRIDEIVRKHLPEAN